MRTIKTADGEEITGAESSFEDKGDHVVKSTLFSETRIYKQNIVSDKSESSGVAAAVIGIALGIPFLGG